MYDDLLADIEGVFANAVWTSNTIPTFPDNYQGTIGSNISEYVRLNVMPSNSDAFNYERESKVSGLIAVKIFVAAGEGQGRTLSIADLLDISLQNKTLPNGTSLGTSYLNVEGLDPSNKSLYSASYIIPFTKYGE
jgi:hypothetical protein